MIVTEREREAETQAEGEAGSTQGARHGTLSRDPTTMPGRRQSHPGCPGLVFISTFSRL